MLILLIERVGENMVKKRKGRKEKEKKGEGILDIRYGATKDEAQAPLATRCS